MQSTLPRIFGRFVLIDRLAKGGMGEIFVAAPRVANGRSKLCAVKTILRGRSRDFAQRFREEGALLTSMRHPNVVDVFEMGRVGLEHYMAMEMVVGQDASRLLRRGHRLQRLLPPAGALWIIHQLLAALAYCHRHTDECGSALGVIHRDVSPGNVLVSYDGYVKLADFGLAYSARKITRTAPDVVLGKMGYMAPERLLGAPTDQRADIFAAGVLLFELLTGVRFAPSRMANEFLRMAARRAHHVPSMLRPALPQAVDRLVQRAVAMDPDQRFSSAEAFQEALCGVLAAIDPTYGARQLAEEVMAPWFHEDPVLARLDKLIARHSLDGQWLEATREWQPSSSGRSHTQGKNWADTQTEVDLLDPSAR
ncbi:MAG: serine/threonine protein kinase [Deltaproteobacteria bacterium]|nr:serine/threonine protein kinase [Deltaproteobacteria bacterium]